MEQVGEGEVDSSRGVRDGVVELPFAFLMPISFYHGFETAAPAILTRYPDQDATAVR